MNKPTHDKIYLVPEDGIYCWSTTPAPGAQHESNDAFEYVRGDLFETMKSERDALAAQLHQLNKLHSDLTNADGVSEDGERVGYLITNDQIEEFEHLLGNSQQCLRDLQAEAVMGFVAFVFAQYESGEYHVTAREKYRQLNSRPQGQTVSVHNDPEYCGVLGNAEKYAESVRQGGAE